MADKDPRADTWAEDRFTWQAGDVGFSKEPYWNLSIFEVLGGGGWSWRSVLTRADMDEWLTAFDLTIDDFVEQFPDKYNLMPAEVEESYYPFSDYMPLKPGQKAAPVEPLEE